MTDTDKARKRAEHFKAYGGTREEYLASVADSVRKVAKAHGWTHADEIRELQAHLAVAHVVWKEAP